MQNPLEVFKAYLFKKKESLFTNTHIKIPVGHNSPLYTTLSVLEKDKNHEYQIKILKNGNFFVKHNLFKFELLDLAPIEEDYNDMYLKYVNITNKKVVDIGGYMGVSAILFSKLGKAKEVDVYEVHPKHIKYIQKNIKLNKLEDKIHLIQAGVHKTTGTMDISTDWGGMDFYVEKGHNTKVKLISWENVLKKPPYLMKVDCEGCEKYLAKVANAKIKKVPMWIIETHSYEIENIVVSKFKKCGYKKQLIGKLSKNVNLFLFSNF